MANHHMIDSEISAVFSEIQYLIRFLYSTNNLHGRNMALHQLWNKTSHLNSLVHIVQNERNKALQQPSPNGIHPFQQFSPNAVPVQGQPWNNPNSQQADTGFPIPIQTSSMQSTQLQPTKPISPPPQTIQPFSLPTQPAQPSQPSTTNSNPNGQTFTWEQLAQYTGLNGMPAYVAVNGVVYDVTNNAAWSAATHFGLRAGTELTGEFASCHAGQNWILAQLTPVGRLI